MYRNSLRDSKYAHEKLSYLHSLAKNVLSMYFLSLSGYPDERPSTVVRPASVDI